MRGAGRPAAHVCTPAARAAGADARGRRAGAASGGAGGGCQEMCVHAPRIAPRRRRNGLALGRRCSVSAGRRFGRLRHAPARASAPPRRVCRAPAAGTGCGALLAALTRVVSALPQSLRAPTPTPRKGPARTRPSWTRRRRSCTVRARSPPAGCAAARCTRRAPLRRVLRRAHRPPPARADEKVSSELKTNIMKARLEKKMTQAQLAQVRPCCDAATRAPRGIATARAHAPPHAHRRPSTSCPRLCRTMRRARPSPTKRCVRSLAHPSALQPAPPSHWLPPLQLQRACCGRCGVRLTRVAGCGAQIISKMERILGVPLRPKKK